MKWIYLPSSLLLLSCSSTNTGQVPPPSQSSASYALWSDQQLESKAAALKRTLGRSYDSGNESMGAALFTKMALDDKQEELQGIESELMRRDPSGKLLDQANKM